MRHVMVPVLLAAAACVAAQHTLAQHSEGVRVAVTKAPANGERDFLA